jgi:hypothetical protein
MGAESSNGKLRDELLNGEIFYTLKEAQVIMERWRIINNIIGRDGPKILTWPPVQDQWEGQL